MILDRVAFKVLNTRDYCKLFLWIPQLLLQAIFFWPRQKNAAFKKNVVFVIAFFLFNFMNFGLIVRFRYTLNDILEFALHATFMTVGFQATAKMLVLYHNSKELELILDDIINKFWPYDLLGTKIKNDIKSFYYGIIVIMLANILFGTTYSIMIMVTPWKTRSFPFEVLYPFFDCKQSPYYETIYILQFFTIQYLMYCVCLGCDFAFLTICSCVIMQYKLLQNALLLFNTKLMDEINAKLRKIGTDEMEANGYNTHKEYFVRCIKHHNILLGITKKMNRMFSSIEMVQLACSMTGVCVGIFGLTSLENAKVSSIIIILVYTVIYLVELFVYCIIGNELHYQANFLPDFIFRSNWSEYGDKIMTKDIMFMLHRSQDIPQLTAYNMYDINMDSYIKVIKLSFSVYTFMSKMKDK